MNGLKRTLWTGVFALALGVSVSPAQRYNVGEIVENFELLDRSNNMPVRLSELEGNVIFLEWFAWWCPFCVAAAAEIGPGIVEHYRNAGGNLNGVPVKHVGINLQGQAESETQQFINSFGLGLVLNDFDQALADRFAARGQPIFAIINGVADSPSHRQWELLFSELGYGETDFPIAMYRQIIDRVQPAETVEPPGPIEPPGPGEPPGPLTLVRSPVDQSVRPGQRADFVVAATGTVSGYQWMKDGEPIPGQTTARLVIEAASAADAATYVATVTSATDSLVSASARLIVDETVTGRLTNLSTNSYSENGDNGLQPGWSADGPMQLLVRAVGPSLATFGVANFLPDPRLEVQAGGMAVASNDDWEEDGPLVASEIRDTSARVGAFALLAQEDEGGADAALIYAYDGGPRTALVFEADDTAGNILVEVYEVPDPSRAGILRNLSTRGLLNLPGQEMAAGFVVGGSRARTLLIRGVGPELDGFGVTNFLPDPQLSIVNNQVAFASNDDWQDDAGQAIAIADLGGTAGAFPLTEGSRDAAMVITLSPGSYTVQISGKDEDTGIVLAEIYDVTDQ